MRHLRVLAGAALLAVTALAPAYAVEDDRPPRIGGKHVPKIADLAAMEPEFDGGRRELDRRAKWISLSAHEDCVQGAQVAKAVRGTDAGYWVDKEGTTSFELGLDDPRVRGRAWRTPADARGVMDALRAWGQRCQGFHESEAGNTNDLVVLEDPDAGDEALATLRDHTEAYYPGDEDDYRVLDTFVRFGRHVIWLQVFNHREDPSLDDALTLVELTRERIGLD